MSMYSLLSVQCGADRVPSKGSEPLEGLADGFLINLRVRHDQGAFTNTARILFSEKGTPGLDPADAPKLSPAGLAERWLSFYSLGEDGRSYTFQSLPSEILTQEDLSEVESKITLPLDIHSTESGPYPLTWSLPNQQAFAGSYFLYQQTSKVFKTLEVFEKNHSKNLYV